MFIKFFIIFTLFVNFLFSAEEINIQTEKVYFSPNYDGINDTIVFKIDYTGKKKITNYIFQITDENSRIIKTISADKRHQNKKNFISSIFVGDESFLENEIFLPKEILWLGNDNSGRAIPDGRYIYQLKIFFNDKSEINSKPTYLYLDSIAPYAKITSENKFFTPNNDKILDTISIKQELVADSSDRWYASFKNEFGLSIKTYTWDTKTAPKIITWDGKDDRGILQPEGVYTYELKGEDFSENKFVIQIENIYLSRGNENSDVQTNLSSFSPDGDKLKDTLQFKVLSSDKGISKWEVIIYQKSSNNPEALKNIAGTNIGESFQWDGKNNQGKILSDGEYFFRGKFTANSKTIFSPERKFEINTQNKKIKFKIKPNEFTPDGDYNDDLLEILPELEHFTIKTWKLTILQNYEINGVAKKEIIKKWRGVGKPANKIYWDGYSDTGILIGSLSDLELHFSFRNELNELKFYKVKTFQTGILVNPHGNKLRVSIPEFIFKKDESGIISDLKSIIKKFPGYKVEIQSHSKQPGNNLENMTKTETRAKNIYKRMFGVEKDFSRFTYRGFGEVEPFFTEDNEYKQERNDRIDVLLTEPSK